MLSRTNLKYGDRAKVAIRRFVFPPLSAHFTTYVVTLVTYVTRPASAATRRHCQLLRVAKAEGLKGIGSFPLLDRLLTDIQ